MTLSYDQRFEISVKMTNLGIPIKSYFESEKNVKPYEGVKKNIFHKKTVSSENRAEY